MVKNDTNKFENFILGFVVGILILGIAIYFIQPDIGTLTTSDRADLRLIAMPYLEATNLKDVCIDNNAAWHESKDFVGCVGLGPTSCTSEIVLSGQAQCIGVGANFYCETGTQGFIYCKY